MAPWFLRTLAHFREHSGRQAGWLGLAIFYAAAYGALYYAYLIVEMRGPGALLPASWR